MCNSTENRGIGVGCATAVDCLAWANPRVLPPPKKEKESTAPPANHYSPVFREPSLPPSSWPAGQYLEDTGSLSHPFIP